ncbi:MAG: 2-oxoacid:acceptor oxidoreductase family protein [Deltaproteobacteria bacterium]|nr:2-oxoacid:acceptor oxidoreductase family protein [Deltaproteobacteria bacterium]
MYRIRFHGRGGQGMKTASRILGTAFFLEGFEVQDAQRYGAERRGAPIFAYVRASSKPIKERGIIQRPDLVIVADDTLLLIDAPGVLKGMTPQSVLLLNSEEDPEVWKDRLNFSGAVFALPDVQDLKKPTEQLHIGTVCAAAGARFAGVISQETLKQAIQDELESLGEPIVEENLEQALRVYDLMEAYAGKIKPSSEPAVADYPDPAWIDMPYEDARISAPAIHAAATSLENPTGLWRTLRPVIKHDRCHRCSWICSTFCPENAISVNENGYPQIDYQHCKGCLLCMEQCPHHAIESSPEHTKTLESDKGDEI